MDCKWLGRIRLRIMVGARTIWFGVFSFLSLLESRALAPVLVNGGG